MSRSWEVGKKQKDILGSKNTTHKDTHRRSHTEAPARAPVRTRLAVNSRTRAEELACTHYAHSFAVIVGRPSCCLTPANSSAPGPAEDH